MSEDDPDRKRDSGNGTDPSRDGRSATDDGHRFETTIGEGVLRVRRPGTRWLSSGSGGGFRVASAAYNVSVPTGFSRTDLNSYVAERRREAGFPEPGPTLLTGLALDHARGARSGSVSVVATAGLSNPATLPMDPDTVAAAADADADDATGGTTDSTTSTGVAGADDPPPGTVNVLVVTDHALDDGGLTTLLATVVEAKTATLLAATGFSGTTSDAVVVGCDLDGERAKFVGSATPVGAAARACVRDAVLASLRSRYPDGGVPETVDAAEYGVRTARSTDAFRL
jgi:adenosylcobinamide hydrolase